MPRRPGSELIGHAAALLDPLRIEAIRPLLAG